MELEEMFTVHVKIEKTIELQSNDGDSVVMISFTGHVTGQYFQGEVLEGGVDTQVIGKYGDRHTLSARYMLRGKDYTGEVCQIYIENNGDVQKKLKDTLFRTNPKLITNSKALSFLNEDLFVGEALPTDLGVDIKIYRWL
ncbi:DUF3237 domain-containing protein [Paenibacillus wynnii]|uniref:DUF3237 domain-containing protein n=1 Tax=Paenibacillus wynnii TaxID=268407 RepID=UPI0027931C6D|nr:DUF3237 domain-containing protein [Paenibacillus wynnii]MDQ0192079.1 hypothetical protein [Paenibacillus wynnii]